MLSLHDALPISQPVRNGLHRSGKIFRPDRNQRHDGNDRHLGPPDIKHGRPSSSARERQQAQKRRPQPLAALSLSFEAAIAASPSIALGSSSASPSFFLFSSFGPFLTAFLALPCSPLSFAI